jgi:hypothetical protein
MYIEWKRNKSCIYKNFSLRQVDGIILRVFVNIIFGTEVREDNK